MSSSSTPSYTPASYSTNASGTNTGRSEDIPPSHHYESTDSETEASSERDPYDGPRVSPNAVLPRPIIVQPPPPEVPRSGPRIRQTARKSVPIPRRVTLTTPRPEAPEPSRVVPGMPVGRMTELGIAREQHIRAMTAELHGCQVRVTHQGQTLSELVDLTHQLTYISTQARENARMAKEMASKAQAIGLVVGMVLMALLFLLVLGAYLA